MAITVTVASAILSCSESFKFIEHLFGQISAQWLTQLYDKRCMCYANTIESQKWKMGEIVPCQEYVL